MPHRVDWLIEDEVLLYIFWGEMTTDDLRSALTEVTQYIAESPQHSIHTISDIRSVTIALKMQDSMKVVREFREDAKTGGWSITVGKLDIVTKMGIAVSRSLLKNKSTSFDTMDEALNHLKQEDSNLSWDKANMDLLEFNPSQ